MSAPSNGAAVLALQIYAIGVQAGGIAHDLTRERAALGPPPLRNGHASHPLHHAH